MERRTVSDLQKQLELALHKVPEFQKISANVLIMMTHSALRDPRRGSVGGRRRRRPRSAGQPRPTPGPTLQVLPATCGVSRRPGADSRAPLFGRDGLDERTFRVGLKVSW